MLCTYKKKHKYAFKFQLLILGSKELVCQALIPD